MHHTLRNSTRVLILMDSIQSQNQTTENGMKTWSLRWDGGILNPGTVPPDIAIDVFTEISNNTKGRVCLQPCLFRKL